MKFSFNEFHLWHQLGLSLMAAGKVSSFLLIPHVSVKDLVDSNSNPKLAAVFKELRVNVWPKLV